MFQSSIKPIATILQELGIEGLGEFQEKTGLYSQWPQAAQWQSYVAAIANNICYLPKPQTAEQIETELADIEKDFNNYLQINTTAGKPKDHDALIEDYSQVSWMLERSQQVGQQIRHPSQSAHATYPYFLRQLLLHFALLSVRDTQEDPLAQTSMIELFKDAYRYLANAMQSAYTYRASQIQLELTGSYQNRLFIKDSYFGHPLSQEVPLGQTSPDLFVLQTYVRACLAKDYAIQTQLHQGCTAIDQLIAGQITPPNSSIQKEDYGSATDIWTRYCEQWTDATTEAWEAAKTSASALVGSAASLSKETPIIAVQGSASDPSPPDPSRRPIAQAICDAISDDDIVGPARFKDGSLPLPKKTDIIQGVFTFVKWIISVTSDKPTWEEVVRELERRIKLLLSEHERERIKNQIKGIENNYDDFLKLFALEVEQDPDVPMNEQHRTRLIGVIQLCRFIQPAIYEPAISPYISAPYVDRFFFVFASALATAQIYLPEYQEFLFVLFQDTTEYFDRARNQLRNERHNEIKLDKGFVYGSGDQTWVWDYRNDARPNNSGGPRQLANNKVRGHEKTRNYMHPKAVLRGFAVNLSRPAKNVSRVMDAVIPHLPEQNVWDRRTPWGDYLNSYLPQQMNDLKYWGRMLEGTPNASAINHGLYTYPNEDAEIPKYQTDDPEIKSVLDPNQ
ncbi:MAG: hypothetical protein F6K47_17600 [Symploca sp. SIO2E6]|nr:hypothetical protein [Symploca sp. SIO2E6]